MSIAHKVSTCFWFEGEAEQAAELYVSLIPNSEILNIVRHGEGGALPKGTALMVSFTLDGTPLLLLNAGPMFKQSEAASISVACEDQAEIDRLWAALTADGGQEGHCGWLKDRWGVSWQIVPKQMEEWMSRDPACAARVTAAFMPMSKLDVAILEAAARG